MKNKIDEQIEKKLIRIIEEHPTDLVMWMLIQMGKMVLETNAATLDLKQQSTFDGKRYEITAVVKVKRVKDK